jgi:hypothetical protein
MARITQLGDYSRNSVTTLCLSGRAWSAQACEKSMLVLRLALSTLVKLPDRWPALTRPESQEAQEFRFRVHGALAEHPLEVCLGRVQGDSAPGRRSLQPG